MPRGVSSRPRLVFALLLGIAASAAGVVSPLGAQAPAEPAKSSTHAIRQYRDAVTFQNRALYDLAADEWEKFLEKFPQDPLAAKAEHYLGVCRLQLKEYDKAEKAFKHVASAYPNFELLDVNYLDLGLAQYSQAQAKKAPPAESVETLTALVTKFPASKRLGQAYFYLGESLYACGRKAEAAEAYVKSIEKDSEKSLRAEALNALGVTRQELNKPAEAAGAFNQFLQEFPSHPLKAEVTLHQAETQLALGKFAEAEKGFAAARATPGFASADYAMLREAECLAQQKKYPEAAALDAELVQKFPQSTYAGAASLAAGNCYYLAGNFPEAEAWLGKVAGAGGEPAAEAAHWLARAFLKQKKPADAQKVAEQALASAGKSPYAIDLTLDRADATFDAGKHREAIPLYAALAKEHPEHAAARTALYMAGFASLGERDYPAASTHADSFLKTYPDSPLANDARYVGAEAKLLAGDYSAAVTLYDALLAGAANNSEAPAWNIRRATALLLAKKYPEVVSSLVPRMASFKTPEEQAEAHFLVGSAQLESGEAEPAAKELSASLAAAPKWRQADETLLMLSAAYRQLKKLPEALATVRKVPAEFPESRLLDRAEYRIGEYSYAMNDFRAAATAYRGVLEKWPTGPFASYAMIGLGWSELELNEPAPAEEAFTNLIEKHPQNPLVPQAYSGRARARQSLQKHAEAIADVDAYLKSNPMGADRSNAAFIKGFSSAALGKNAEAIAAFQSILKDDPGYAEADKVLYELAWSRVSEKQEDAATETFALLAAKHPDSPLAPESSYRVGQHEYQAKRYAQAAEAYYAAMNKGGKSELGEKAAYKLAWTYYQQGQYDKARQSFEYLVASFPAGPHKDDGEFMTAECLFKQNNLEPAWAAYQKVMAKPPDNKDSQFLALFHAGQTATQLHKWEEGAKLLERAAQEFPDVPNAAEISFELAGCKQNMGDLDGAFKLYEKAADADREVGARARFMMGETQFGKKDFREAVRQFMKVAYGYGYPQSPDPIKKWQADAVFEAGRCFENMRKLDDAKKSYTEVIEKYPSSSRAAAAKARLQALGS